MPVTRNRAGVQASLPSVHTHRRLGGKWDHKGPRAMARQGVPALVTFRAPREQRPVLLNHATELREQSEGDVDRG